MKLTIGIPVHIGNIHGYVYGGPFKHYEVGTRRLVGVKMAEEIDHPHDISIPTEDFSVPSQRDMEQGLIKALASMNQGNDIYAGCMGGIGRTGLFMGCMARVQFHYAGSPDDPVAFVRKHFKPHAIETREQQNFVRNFDTTKVIEYILALEEAKEVIKYVAKVEKVEVVITPWMWFKRKLQSIAPW